MYEIFNNIVSTATMRPSVAAVHFANLTLLESAQVKLKAYANNKMDQQVV
jgi:hypothetical protein